MSGAETASPQAPSRRVRVERFLDELAERSFRYFVEAQHPHTGLVLDRARNAGTQGEDRTVASIAATGFGLAAFAVGAERGWIGEDEARGRVERTLRFALERLPGERGFYYHFVDWETGARRWRSEVSSIDTALLLAGALAAAGRFRGLVEELALALYARADFEWMRTDGGTKPESKTLSMGWTPERGFIPHRWDGYSEHWILYLLAAGAPEHPIPPQCWRALPREPEPRSGAAGGDLPLFVHQYPHVFVDFARWRDGLFDYWENSRKATLYNRAFTRSRAGRFRTFARYWGLSASDGPEGYRAYAPRDDAIDGTVCPAAALTSILFAEEIVLGDLAEWLERPEFRALLGKYGLADAFNMDRGWKSADVIGITLGALLLALENRRSGLVWRWFESVHAVAEGLRRSGFVRSEGRN